jgi:hypothetical protein
MKKTPLSFIEKVKSTLADALYVRVGHGRDIDYAVLADKIGDDDQGRNLRNYATAGAMMPLHKFLKAAEVLGPDLVNTMLRLIGMDGAYRTTATDGNPHAVNCELAETIQLISAALRDGRITERERPKIIAALNELIEQAHSYVAALTNQQQEGK